MRALIIPNMLPSTKELLRVAVENKASLRPIEIIQDNLYATPKAHRVGNSGMRLKHKLVSEIVQPIFDELSDRRDEIRKTFQIKKRLQFSEFRCYINAMTDGDALAPHIDRGRFLGTNLELVFLLYFHTEPKQFTGGELALHWKDGEEIIDPTNNTLVVFPATTMHSVKVVSSSSRDPENFRYVVVGRIFRPPGLRELVLRVVGKLTRMFKSLKESTFARA